jgi:hypothetical protein
MRYITQTYERDLRSIGRSNRYPSPFVVSIRRTSENILRHPLSHFFFFFFFFFFFHFVRSLIIQLWLPKQIHLFLLLLLGTQVSIQSGSKLSKSQSTSAVVWDHCRTACGTEKKENKYCKYCKEDYLGQDGSNAARIAATSCATLVSQP